LLALDLMSEPKRTLALAATFALATLVASAAQADGAGGGRAASLKANAASAWLRVSNPGYRAQLRQEKRAREVGRLRRRASAVAVVAGLSGGLTLVGAGVLYFGNMFGVLGPSENVQIGAVTAGTGAFTTATVTQSLIPRERALQAAIRDAKRDAVTKRLDDPAVSRWQGVFRAAGWLPAEAEGL